MGGPHLRFLCASDTLTPLNRVSTGSRCGFWNPRRFAALVCKPHRSVRNALGQPGPENVDRLVAAAYSGGTLVAAAGASEDAPRLWQIGVDTIKWCATSADSRPGGLAVNRAPATPSIAPYYSTLISNPHLAACRAERWLLASMDRDGGAADWSLIDVVDARGSILRLSPNRTELHASVKKGIARKGE